MIPRSVFCEALHSEASHRKRETNRQDLAFFKRRFIDFGGKKKGEQEAGALHLLDVSQEQLPHTGENASTFLPSWKTDQPWLLVKHKC